MSSQHRSICPVSCALDLLGDKWSLLIIRDMLFNHKKYFKEFHNSNEGIATNILADRLKKLERDRVINKQQDPNHGRQVIYTLTKRGLDLTPVLVDLALWGAEHTDTAALSEKLKKRLRQDRQGFIKETQENYWDFLDTVTLAAC